MPKTSSANVGLALQVDVNKACEDFCSRLNQSTVNRGQATQDIVSHFRTVYPKFNCMVVHTQHLHSFHDYVHSHMELKCSWFGTIGFEIYIFKRGNFTLLGDGGYENWAFGGNFRRESNKVVFDDI